MVLDENKYKQILILRKNGKSYSEISASTGLAKSTLSNWLGNMAWSNEIRIGLDKSRLDNSKKNLENANIARLKNVKNLRKGFVKQARLEFKRLINDPLFLVGLGIYWGEGDKTDNGRVAVINTDPELMRVTAKFYRKFLEVAERDLRVGLFVYEDINIDMAKEFWSEKLKIPQSQFIRVQVLKSRSKLTKNRSKYGICSLYFSNTEFNVKIHEWLRLLSVRDLRV